MLYIQSVSPSIVEFGVNVCVKVSSAVHVHVSVGMSLLPILLKSDRIKSLSYLTHLDC